MHITLSLLILSIEGVPRRSNQRRRTKHKARGWIDCDIPAAGRGFTSAVFPRGAGGENATRQQSAAEANQNFGLGGSAHAQLRGEMKLTMANSEGMCETQDLKARKSQEVTSGQSGGTASNSRIQGSPTHHVQGTSNGALGATSHQTFNNTQ